MGALLAIIAGLVTVIGNVFAKEWTMRGSHTLLAAAIFFYVIGSFVFPFSLRYGTLSVLNTLSSMFVVLATLCVGWIYREHLSAMQTVGLALGIVSILLLTLPSKA